MEKLLKKAGKQLGIDITNLSISYKVNLNNITNITLSTVFTTELGRIDVSHYPSCCGISIIHSVRVYDGGKRYASLLTRIAELYSLEKFDKCVVCGTIAGKDRPKMVSMLTKYGWTIDREFKNFNTYNKVVMMSKRLKR